MMKKHQEEAPPVPYEVFSVVTSSVDVGKTPQVGLFV
jgi:hypothetical protein